ncbi:MAG: PadR family transcriptional regulator [Solobacterium sp.]|nr:PadR family transcriptional regulator [Solobacterium sp.]
MNDTQFKKGILPLCVLSILANKGDCYGYEITTLVSEELNVNAATIYLILNRFVEMGYLTVYVVNQEKRPQRKYYHLNSITEINP